MSIYTSHPPLALSVEGVQFSLWQPKITMCSYALAPCIESPFIVFATLADAGCTIKAISLALKASGAVAAFWSFFAVEKGLSPRGYEREKI